MAKGNAIASMRQQENDWRVERDLETMMEAEKIERDPKRLKLVQELAKKKMLEIASVASEAPESGS